MSCLNRRHVLQTSLEIHIQICWTDRFLSSRRFKYGSLWDKYRRLRYNLTQIYHSFKKHIFSQEQKSIMRELDLILTDLNILQGHKNVAQSVSGLKPENFTERQLRQSKTRDSTTLQRETPFIIPTST